MNNDARKVILNMVEKKVKLTGVLPTGILKGCVDSYVSILTKIINTLIGKREVIPLSTKEGKLSKEKYRSVSVLSHTSNIFEKTVF